jgi:plasmid stabilization system protein ParE
VLKILLARAFAPSAAPDVDRAVPGPAPAGPAPAGEQSPTRDELLLMLATVTAANEAMAAAQRRERAAAARQDSPGAPQTGCRRCAELEQRLLDLQAVNEGAYRVAYDASGGPRLDPGQPFGDPAPFRINLLKGL